VAVELLSDPGKTVNFVPLLVINDEKVLIGNPEVKEANVVATVIDADKQAEKVTAIRYKAKKRVKKVHGHRQHQTILEIKQITQKP
jgi:large subunit ribosomal protein L21